MASRRGPRPGKKVRNKAFNNAGMGGGESAADRAERLKAKEVERTQKLINAELADTQGIDDALNAYEDMRAQELDDIKYATKEADEVKSAQEFLQRRYKAMSDVGLPGAPEAGSAGKGYFSLAAHLDGLGELTADVPEAYHWQFGNGAKLRIGTEYGDVDSFTGQRSVVPSADPTDSTKALTMFEGTQNQARAVGKLGSDANGLMGSPRNATEYIQRQLMRRMGRKVEMNNSKEQTATDFIEDGIKPVDGQTYNSTQPYKFTEVYTDVRPGSNVSPQLATKEVRDRINDGIRQAPKASLKGILTRMGELDTSHKLSLRGGYNKDSGPYPGKLYDETYHPKDSIFYTDYLDDEAARLIAANHTSGSFSDTEALAPNAIREEDVPKARKLLQSKRGSDLQSTIKVIPKERGASKVHANWTDSDRKKFTKTTPQFIAEKPEVGQFLRNVENGVEVTPSSGISTDPVGTPKAPPKSAAGLDVEDITPVKRRPTPRPIIRGGGQAGGQFLEAPFIRNTVDVIGGIAKNPGVRMAGVALGAIPVLGDAADAATGTYDAVTKEGDAQVRGAGNAAAGITGLTALAAPAAAPVLAPVSAGLGIGNAVADMTIERRAKDSKYTSNAGLTSKHIHTDEAPVTIQALKPQPILSETERRRAARRSTGGGKSARPVPGENAGAWWNKALESLGL